MFGYLILLYENQPLPGVTSSVGPYEQYRVEFK